jgi:hypothetical protein
MNAVTKFESNLLDLVTAVVMVPVAVLCLLWQGVVALWPYRKYIGLAVAIAGVGWLFVAVCGCAGAALGVGNRCHLWLGDYARLDAHAAPLAATHTYCYPQAAYLHPVLTGGDAMKLMMIIAVAAMIYLAMQSAGNAAETATNGPGCVAAYDAEYSAKWGEMTPLQRAWVGANAAGCTP